MPVLILEDELTSEDVVVVVVVIIAPSFGEVCSIGVIIMIIADVSVVAAVGVDSTFPLSSTIGDSGVGVGVAGKEIASAGDLPRDFFGSSS